MTDRQDLTNMELIVPRNSEGLFSGSQRLDLEQYRGNPPMFARAPYVKFPAEPDYPKEEKKNLSVAKMEEEEPIITTSQD